ncbi:MAG: hypothetical protein PHQ35_05140 [Phycisphaerae bacterium]|nr:hypothetical protein [Phycisphaerae bacterium]MDD5380898.1 hypothetical protein [Phycisphaerae bacterium]
MKILDILRKAEEDLREAIAEAARAGEYRDVDIGRTVAVNIKELCERISGNGIKSSKPLETKEGSASRKKQKKVSRRNKPEGLPRIEIRNGSLYRIGWSRKQKKEYEHKVPRAAVDTIVNTMSALAKEGSGPFMAEAVINKINATTEDSMPAYQVYVVLAALREWNLISQDGRDGYNIPPDVAEKAKTMWTELASR